MKNKTKRLKHYFCTLIAVGCGLLVANPAQAQVIYSINASTNFGSNTANAGTGPTFTDSDSDGNWELAHAPDSGNNNAIFIDSSDGLATQTIDALTQASSLGRALLSTDTVVVSGSVAPTDTAGNFFDAIANGFEMGIHSVVGFRANPNILIQLRATNQASGAPAFFEYVANTTTDPVTGLPVGAGLNVRNNLIPAIFEPSLNDGFSFSVAYSATDIVFTATDVIDFATMEPISISYTFTHGVDATSSGGTTGFDFLTDVGAGYAYFSQQHAGAGFPEQSIEFASFQIEVMPETSGGPCGDVNLDGSIDFLDIAPFIALLSNGGFQSEADCLVDGVVDFLDIAPFIGVLSAQ